MHRPTIYGRQFERAYLTVGLYMAIRPIDI